MGNQRIKTLSEHSQKSNGSIRMRRTVGLFGAIAMVVGAIIGRLHNSRTDDANL